MAASAPGGQSYPSVPPWRLTRPLAFRRTCQAAWLTNARLRAVTTNAIA